jgi:hypothetical protein
MLQMRPPLSLLQLQLLPQMLQTLQPPLLQLMLP